MDKRETIKSLIDSEAKFYRAELPPEAMKIWLEEMTSYDTEIVRAAFKRHRATAERSSTGMMHGEMWPKAVRIHEICRAIIAEQTAGKPRNCGQCDDGWVVAYWKEVGPFKKKIPYLKRCECKQVPA